MAGINNIDYREYFPSLKFRNNMENKPIIPTNEIIESVSIGEETIHLITYEPVYEQPESDNMENKQQAAEHYAHNNFKMHVLNHYKALENGFIAGASWQSSQPINSELTQLRAENERLRAKLMQCIDDCQKQVDLFDTPEFETSKNCSMAMKFAYTNIVNFINH